MPGTLLPVSHELGVGDITCFRSSRISSRSVFQASSDAHECLKEELLSYKPNNTVVSSLHTIRYLNKAASISVSNLQSPGGFQKAQACSLNCTVGCYGGIAILVEVLHETIFDVAEE